MTSTNANTDSPAGNDFLETVASALVLFALPVAMVYSSKSAPTVFFAGLAVLLVSRIRQDGARSTFDDLLAELPRAWTLLGVAVAALLIASTLWSLDTRRGINVALQASGTIGGLLLWSALEPRRNKSFDMIFLASGLSLALAGIAIEVLSSVSIRGMLGLKVWRSMLNRPIVTASAYSFLLIIIVLRRHPGRLMHGIASCLVILTALMAFQSDSQSAAVFWLAAVAVLIFSFIAGKLAFYLVFAGTIFVVVTFPLSFEVVGGFVEQLDPKGPLGSFAKAGNAAARLMIWRDYASLIGDHFVFGWGLGSESAVQRSSLSIPGQPIGAHYHPHSFSLQLWFSLGLAGALLAVVTILMTANSLRPIEGAQAHITLALVAGLIVIWSVSHGAWQAWWLTVSGFVMSFALREARDPDKFPPRSRRRGAHV